MSDDPVRTLSATAAVDPVPVSLDEPEPLQGHYVQITEVEATPVTASDAIERRDPWGRVPVVVRIRRQPPIRIEFLLLAIALGASGLFLELWIAVRAVLVVGAVIAAIAGLLSRIFIRVPPGTVGLTIKGGTQAGVLREGIHTVSPLVALTHLVTIREIAFDVPVNEVRSADGVAVAVDLMLTITIADPAVFAYQVATGDADALVHAAAQDAVRATLRGIEALAALDLGADQAARLRETLDGELARYGLAVHAVAFTRVTLPPAFTASLEARRLAAVQLAEAADVYALEQRRIADRGALLAQEAEAKLLAVEHEAAAEAQRLARLEERLAASPAAARYDLELHRIRVAEGLARNTRAVVSMGAGDLVTSLLVAREAGAVSDGQGSGAAPATAPDTAPGDARSTPPA